jgi:hypothetical protein
MIWQYAPFIWPFAADTIAEPPSMWARFFFAGPLVPLSVLILEEPFTGSSVAEVAVRFRLVFDFSTVPGREAPAGAEGTWPSILDCVSVAPLSEDASFPTVFDLDSTNAVVLVLAPALGLAAAFFAFFFGTVLSLSGTSTDGALRFRLSG